MIRAFQLTDTVETFGKFGQHSCFVERLFRAGTCDVVDVLLSAQKVEALDKRKTEECGSSSVGYKKSRTTPPVLKTTVDDALARVRYVRSTIRFENDS